MRMVRRSTIAALASATLVATGTAGATTSPAAAEIVRAATDRATDAQLCAAMTTPVHQAVDDTPRRSLLTRWQSEALGAVQRFGYDSHLGEVVKAGTRSDEGLSAVHRLYHPRTSGFKWVVDADELQRDLDDGYQQQHVDFFASERALSCTAPIYKVNFTVNGRTTTTYTHDEQERNALLAAGGLDDGIAFHAIAPAASPPAPRPKPEDAFTLVVYPDTQTQTLARDTRIKQRSDWVVNNADNLNIKHVLHVGDVTNWGWLAPEQITSALNGMQPLNDANMPYAMAVGNHDTRAVGHDGIPGSRGYGGSAYVNNSECVERLSPEECQTHLLVRQTEEINDAFGHKVPTEGAFEAGKMDNVYTTFEAAGEQWLILTLEFYPRAQAVAWAKNVVATNPDKNVVVLTHMYINGGGHIGNGREYGSTSPQYLYDNLISQYPNIKLVFNGHVGHFAHRTDTPNGNKVASFLSNGFAQTVSVRPVEIDVTNGTVTSSLLDLRDNTTIPGSAVTITGMDFDQ